MEFITTETRLPVITTNFEEVKKYIEEKRDMYRGIIVTEDTLKESGADLSELIKIRTFIDKFRKEKKKEMSAPITAFENQCKELLAIEAEAENPLAEGIRQFDEERRRKKKEQALKFITGAVTDRGLNAKYAAKLEMKDGYVLLTATAKSVREEIGKEADRLLMEQKQEESDIALIRHTVEKENESLLTNPDAEEFTAMMDRKSVQDILDSVSRRASDIREAQKKAEEKAKADMENARRAMEETKVEIPPVITPSAVRVFQEAASGTGRSDVSIPEKKNISGEMPGQWQITFSVTGSFSRMRELCNFLKKEQFSYSVIEQKTTGGNGL